MLFCEKIFSVEQIREADSYTINKEGITSLKLMERAATACVGWINSHVASAKSFGIICGTGNNGGDGLAIARLLLQNPDIECIDVFILYFSKKCSPDFTVNYQKLQNFSKVKVHETSPDSELHIERKYDFLIDAIIGSGLSSPISGWLKQNIEYINSLHLPVISIDIPSGLFADIPPASDITAIHADYTLSFQFPKLSFMFSESELFVGYFDILPIGISKDYIDKTATKNYFINQSSVSHILRKRDKFSHKGNFGHALIVAGSYGKMGAAVLASRSCLRSGAGLLNTHIPIKGVDILQTSFPEAMLSIDKSDNVFSSLPEDILQYDAIGIGPGLGKDMATQKALSLLLKTYQKPLVLDADALNIISKNKDLLKLIPENSIITPHVKEFERLTSNFSLGFDRLETAKSFSKKYNIYTVLKGAYTSICTPEGEIYFNSTGNPGMATAGSGDVLTGIITALLAQNYSSLEAAIIGVFFHGKAGDKAALLKGETSLIATDIIENLAFN